MEELPGRGIDGSLQLMKQLQVVDQFVKDVATLTLSKTKQKRRQRARTEESFLLLFTHFFGCWIGCPNLKIASAFKTRLNIFEKFLHVEIEILIRQNTAVAT
jgi:uncharacterized membrane protein YsdA (DUF1294 family)